jgi:predicted TPR repeat methyltransferase
VLSAGGLFAFTAESLADDRDLALLPSLRYSHSERHLRELAARHGLAMASLLRAPLRREQQHDVEGLYVVLRR